MEMPTIREHCHGNYVLLTNESCPGNRVGIYARGGCDLRLLFGLAPFIRRQGFNGNCCFYREGFASDSRSDLVLQTLKNLPKDMVQPVIDKLHLGVSYFKPSLFEKTFTLPGMEHLGEFPKTVVIISIGPDVIRTVYRHRKHGFLTDPGGGWLNQSMEKVLNDLSAVSWFRENFESIGMIPLEESVANYTRIIKILRERIGGHLLVLNTLTLEPGSLTHNYQFVKDLYTTRRRELNIALVEMSRQLDFSVIDLDRVLKRAGTTKQVDFGHPPPETYPLISQEVYRIIHELGVFDNGAVRGQAKCPRPRSCMTAARTASQAQLS
jgi:hypothetical protein